MRARVPTDGRQGSIAVRVQDSEVVFAGTVPRGETEEVAVARASEELGTITLVANVAGGSGSGFGLGPLLQVPADEFRRVLDVNVVGVFLGMKYVLPVMLRQNKGSIINTASIAGLVGSPHIAVYSASKHAVIGLTKSAAWECTGTGVRVNCVCPGMIDSRMLSAIIQGRAGGNAPPPADKIVERIPARRLGQVSEVASIVAFVGPLAPPLFADAGLPMLPPEGPNWQ